MKNLLILTTLLSLITTSVIRSAFAAETNAVTVTAQTQPKSPDATLDSKSSQLEDDFKAPPRPARLQAYWFWVDSNFSKEGITKDLEAMKAAGFGAALILNVGMGPSNQPWPEQTYRSQAWFDAVKHAAAEADRLGMTIGLANAPGYTGTGGPWVPEEQNMRELVWTQREVEGPKKLDITLPKPGSREAGVSFGRPAKPSTGRPSHKDHHPETGR